MSNATIIRAWKDPIYRNSLSESERSALPANPAGAIEIAAADLGKVAGGANLLPTTSLCTIVSCGCSWWQCATLRPLCPSKTS